MGFSTILGTGGMALIAQAFGRKDYDYAATVFKQSILLALIVGVIEAAAGLMIAPAYIKYFGGSGKSLEWGIQSIWWIKLTTAVIEMVVVALWLKAELQCTRMRISRHLQPAG